MWQMFDIYDNETGHLVVGPFSWDRWDDIDMWLSMPDPFLRKVSIEVASLDMTND